MAYNGRASHVALLLLGASICQGAPSFSPKWADESAPTILAQSCDPVTGRCYGWLPIVDPRLDAYDVQPDYDRVQPIHVREVDKVGDAAWSEAARNLATHATANQLGKISKKDVFMSRGWGAGGMPFSVLYMSPRNNHQQSSGGGQGEAAKSGEPLRRVSDESSPATKANNRVSARNGAAYPQSRKHYSIIPQLFISYGWGPSGK